MTGDYSRGASGFMVRDGAIAEPIAEITIASNLLDMFATLEPGSDLEFRRGVDLPTLLVPEMTLACTKEGHADFLPSWKWLSRAYARKAA